MVKKAPSFKNRYASGFRNIDNLIALIMLRYTDLRSELSGWTATQPLSTRTHKASNESCFVCVKTDSFTPIFCLNCLKRREESDERTLSPAREIPQSESYQYAEEEQRGI